MNRRSSLIVEAAFTACAALGHAGPARAAPRVAARALRYFPSGPVDAHRWKLPAPAPAPAPIRQAGRR